jgi:hypothetical protein
VAFENLPDLNTEIIASPTGIAEVYNLAVDGFARYLRENHELRHLDNRRDADLKHHSLRQAREAQEKAVNIAKVLNLVVPINNGDWVDEIAQRAHEKFNESLGFVRAGQTD